MDLLVVAKKLSRERAGKALGSPYVTQVAAAVLSGIRYIKPAAAITLVLAMWLGSAHAQLPFGLDMAAQQKKKQPELKITGIGRFQVFVSPNVKGETFMIDTQTGKVWFFKKDHATGKYSLQRLSVEQVDAKPNEDADARTSDDGQKKPSGSGE